MAEALDKAGITISASSSENTPSASGDVDSSPTIAASGLHQDFVPHVANIQVAKPSLSASSTSSPIGGTTRKYSKPRKSVSFAEDTKEAAEVRSQTNLQKRSNESPKTKNKMPPSPDSILNEENPIRQTPDISFYDEEEDKPFKPVIPENESAEDAAIRRQMIEYNLKEINPIVAELAMEEEEDTYSDAESLNGTDEGSSVDEDEDKFGRTKRRVLSENYLNEMNNLKLRLANTRQTSEAALAAMNDKTTETECVLSSAPPTSTSLMAKGVRFAEELDIQPSAVEPESDTPLTVPRSDGIVNDVRKSIHTPTVIERPYSASTSTTAAAEPDDLDSALLRQEVSSKYHRMRNHMIHRQGGFTAIVDDDEDGEVPGTGADGGPRKMSKFKAARLRQRGN